MQDMIVRLYDLPPLAPVLEGLAASGILIRPAGLTEKPVVLSWVDARFPGWVPEVEAGFSRQPVSCHVAVRADQLLGFACYDVTAKNFFGPTGVDEGWREHGIGKGLLLSVLDAQQTQGYAYAVIGGVGPAEFYERVVGAALIAGSEGRAVENISRNDGE